MPIYEYYCSDNHKIYQFYAKTLAQGRTTPKCPDGAGLKMRKLLSTFSVGGGGREKAEGGPFDSADGLAQGGPAGPGPAPDGSDARLDSAMSAMESEFSSVDENDPRALGRMVRRMSEMTGEKIEGEMEEMVRKLEEGADPEALEAQMGGGEPGEGDPDGAEPALPAGSAREATRPRRRVRRGPPVRDPKLYDYGE